MHEDDAGDGGGFFQGNREPILVGGLAVEGGHQGRGVVIGDGAVEIAFAGAGFGGLEEQIGGGDEADREPDFIFAAGGAGVGEGDEADGQSLAGGEGAGGAADDAIDAEDLGAGPGAELAGSGLGGEFEEGQLFFGYAYGFETEVGESQQGLVGGEHERTIEEGDFAFVEVVAENEARLELELEFDEVVAVPASSNGDVAIDYGRSLEEPCR